MLRVVTVSGEVLYEGFDDVAAEQAANEALPQATSTWSLVGASVNYQRLNGDQLGLVNELAAHQGIMPEQVIRHARTCANCQLALAKKG
jgi:hypothetical protein